MKRQILLFLLFVMSVSFAYAHEEGNWSDEIKIIESKTPCSNLTLEQLEGIGDYYMEQIHPGEQHEIMDQMMGGEGSESLRLAHITIARRIYCGEYTPMMYMGMGSMEMMGRYRGTTYVPYAYGLFQALGFVYIVLIITLVVIILWLVKKKK